MAYHHSANMRIYFVLAGLFLLLSNAMASVPQIEIKVRLLILLERLNQLNGQTIGFQVFLCKQWKSIVRLDMISYTARILISQLVTSEALPIKVSWRNKSPMTKRLTTIQRTTILEELAVLVSRMKLATSILWQRAPTATATSHIFSNYGQMLSELMPSTQPRITMIACRNWPMQESTSLPIWHLLTCQLPPTRHLGLWISTLGTLP